MASLFTSITCNTYLLSYRFDFPLLHCLQLTWPGNYMTRLSFLFNFKVYSCSQQVRGSWFQKCSMCNIRASVCKTRNI
ncbi:hypothetical protein OIU78_003491 [Salix suchowensis]|nr:hypothetical protein OIU78_003491 [Salix suchowensis]